MKFAEINKRYTETVAEYLAKGYTINAGTMNGSQGEIAHIDLTDGNEIIRVVLNSTYDIIADSSYDIIELVVGKCTDNVKPNVNDHWGTIWNNKLEVISREKFFKVGMYSRDWFGTYDEAKAAMLKWYDRATNRRSAEEKPLKVVPGVVGYIKRQKGLKGAKASEVTAKKRIYRDGVSFYVMARGKQFKLA